MANRRAERVIPEPEHRKRMTSGELNMTSYSLPPDRSEPIQVWGSILKGECAGETYYAELPNTEINRENFSRILVSGKSYYRGAF